MLASVRDLNLKESRRCSAVYMLQDSYPDILHCHFQMVRLCRCEHREAKGMSVAKCLYC